MDNYSENVGKTRITDKRLILYENIKGVETPLGRSAGNISHATKVEGRQRKIIRPNNNVNLPQELNVTSPTDCRRCSPAQPSGSCRGTGRT